MTVHAGLLGKKVEQGPNSEWLHQPVQIHQNDVGRWDAILQPGEEGKWTNQIHGLQGATFDAWAEGRDSPFGLSEARHSVADLCAAYVSKSDERVVGVSELERRRLDKYEFVKDLPRMKQQKFGIAYHLKNWDMAKLPLEPAFGILQETGFGAFEALAADTLMFDFSRRTLH